MRPVLYRARKPGLWVATGNSLSQHHPWKPCRDKNGPALGKLCLNTRGPLSRPKYLVPALNLVATLNFCRDTGPKNPCHDREGLCRDPNHPASLGTMLRHRDPCHDTEPESFVARVHCTIERAHCTVARICLLSTPRSGRAPGLRTMSRNEKPLRDTGLAFSVATETQKWAVAHSGLLHLQFLFLFLYKTT